LLCCSSKRDFRISFYREKSIYDTENEPGEHLFKKNTLIDFLKNMPAVLSTDTTLNEEIIRIYGKRWDIELFFKVIKSHLSLAKEFQGRSYDMMLAYTTIVFMRYSMLIGRIKKFNRF